MTNNASSGPQLAGSKQLKDHIEFIAFSFSWYLLHIPTYFVL
jgi:hypothetical protein